MNCYISNFYFSIVKMCPVHPEKSIFFYDISTTYSVGYMLFLMGKTGFDHSQYFIELSLSYFFLSSVRRDVAIRTEASISVCPVIKTVTVIYYTVSCRVGAKLQATNRVPRPVDRGTATRYGG